MNWHESNIARSSATTKVALDVDDVKRPFKVTQGHPLLCQSTRHIYSTLFTTEVANNTKIHVENIQ